MLIVDDNSDTRDLYSLYFRSKGYTVRTALDGRQGIDLALKPRPEAVVMDLSMPALDGISATKQLRRDPRTRPLPILILTGYPARAIQRSRSPLPVTQHARGGGQLTELL